MSESRSTQKFTVSDGLYSQYDNSKWYRTLSPRVQLGLIIGVFAVALGCGILIGWLAFGQSDEPDHVVPPGICDKLTSDGEADIQRRIFEDIDPNNIRETLREWTSFTHMAGTEGEFRIADELYKKWQTQGLDRVSKVTYDVLLSFPNVSDPSVVQILNITDSTPIFTSALKEEPLEPSQNISDIIPPFNAYSAAGDVTGPLIYVNYGRIEDFRLIQENHSIAINGCIAIARYGKIFRGDKAKLAQDFGAVGLILYTDPEDYSSGVVDPYPESWYLPATGVQRGTIFPDNGDPITPGYPSTEYAYRWPVNSTSLPTIPVHPIGFGDAQQLLSRLGGYEAPEDWFGGLNITYKIGPGFTDTNLNTRLCVTSYNKRVNTTNVLGFINGSVEPDRYVLMGNHLDAWVLGAVDPTSGTAAMVEVTRVLSDLVRGGWRPRRTIVFCGWGAEEYALVGSYEWVEALIKPLTDRAVVYLNVDMTISGNDSLRALGVPLITDALFNVTKLLPTPNNSSLTVYDEYLQTFPGQHFNGSLSGVPLVGSLGAGSDYGAFMAFAGVSCLDIRYTYGPSYSLASYPLYHSAYETFDLVNNFIDRNFEYSATVAKIWGELGRSFADSYILPINVLTYADALYRYTQDLEVGYGAVMNSQGIYLDDLYFLVSKLKEECLVFQDRLRTANQDNPLEIRMLNDQMMKMERAFLDPAGLPLRPLLKHVVFAPSLYDAYAGATFPGLTDLMYEIEKSEDQETRWEQVRQHLAAIEFAVQSAQAMLRDTKAFS